MKKTPLKRKSPMKRGKPLAKVSAKRGAQNTKYEKARRKFLGRWQMCQVCESNFSQVIHHVLHREGERLLDEQYWMACCNFCHQEIHDRPAWARASGYLKYDHEIKDTP